MPKARKASIKETRVIKCARQSAPIERLSNEILVCIFERMEAMQLLDLMFVSKRWCTVIQQSSTVWRSALDIGCSTNVHDNVQVICRRLDAILSRSNDKLDRLALPLIIGDDDAEASLNMLFGKLKGVKLRSLYISLLLYPNGEYAEHVLGHLHNLGVTGVDLFAFGIHYDQDEAFDVMEHKDALSDHDTDDAQSFFVTVGKSNRPRDLDHHRLILNQYWPSYITETVKGSNIFANVSVLHIRGTHFSSVADTLALYKMLESVQDQLTELWLSPLSSGLPLADNLIEGWWYRRERAPPKRIRFTKLRHLHLGGDPEECLGRLCYKFECPIVDFISLNEMWSFDILSDGLPPIITSLRIKASLFGYGREDQLVQRYRGLPTLYVVLDLPFDDLISSEDGWSLSSTESEDITDKGFDERCLDALVRIAPAHLVLFVADMSSASEAFDHLVESIFCARSVDKHAFNSITLCSGNPSGSDIGTYCDPREQLNRFKGVVPNLVYLDSEDQFSPIFPPQYYYERE